LLVTLHTAENIPYIFKTRISSTIYKNYHTEMRGWGGTTRATIVDSYWNNWKSMGHYEKIAATINVPTLFIESNTRFNVQVLTME
jgi:hypothetical protein